MARHLGLHKAIAFASGRSYHRKIHTHPRKARHQRAKEHAVSDAVSMPTTLAYDAIPITPNDDTVLNCAGLYIGGTGSVIVRGRSGTSVTFAGVPAGTILPINVNRVMAASTATSIVGFVA